MIEAVGHRHLDDLFPRLRRDCSSRDGVMLLQAITVADQVYDRLPERRGLHQALHLPRRLPAHR
ncbi:MAG: hypothetical protein MZW92_81540 [Comamonadaceae bacterium]|nr:hypothetical protein [Comamonadaceae bacterium]